MLRVSGAFATRFMEELERYNPQGKGTYGQRERAIESFLDALKYDLAKVLFSETPAKNNSPSPTISLDNHPPLS